ncbi:hypothetical protein [Mycolicibacterium neoaurum]|uniref:Integral membrane protein n=1 Tax=Mycolicibacterium neoaurum TaxID=1795 RepID=A0AAV2WRP9_MYCNE|nr:hypothetical protein [Mycolicibacterium neoaurum]CDQ46984.1 putative integral membrane protein [Mycolicibacterium neoaurum]
MRGEKIGEPLMGAVAALVSGLALAGSTTWPTAAVIAAALAFGGVFWVVVWAVTQGAATAFGARVIGEVTNAAARLIMPFVPPIVAGAVDNVSRNVARTVGKPLRQVFTETEEFHFTLRRTHRVTVESDAEAEGAEQPRQVTSHREWVDANGPHIESRRTLILGESDGPAELTSDAGPRQLPPE